MSSPEEEPMPTSEQVNDLFDALESTSALGTEDFKVFLDRVPIPPHHL